MAVIISVSGPYDHKQIQDTLHTPYQEHIFRQVSVLVNRGEITLADDLYIDETTIRSRASRRRIKWRSSAERFSISANNDIQNGIKDLLAQVENGIAEDKDTQRHVEYILKKHVK